MKPIWCKNCGSFLGVIKETFMIPEKLKITCPHCQVTAAYSYTHLGSFVRTVAEALKT